MSDSAIVDGKLTPFERWELPNLGLPGGKPGVNPRTGKDAQTIVLPTAAELEEMQRQAHEEGYQAGIAEASQRMNTLLAAMEQALQQNDNEIAQELLNLSLAVAQKLVQQSLKTNPEILLSTLREAIGNLPHFNQGAHLLLHPEDAAMVRTAMGEQLGHSGWKIFEDNQITRGGVRVETSHSQIDATLENRWQRIVASLGQSNAWIPE